MTAFKSTTTSSTSSTPQCQTPISQTPRSQSPQPQTPSDRQRMDLEHRLESNWNGLLLNDYLNCDSSAAEALFSAEREELAHTSESAYTSPAVAKKVRNFLQEARDALEKRLETDWNGLVWMDWMNCDGGAVQDLWAEERRRLEEVKEQKPDVEQQQGEEKWSSTNTGL